MGLQTQVRTGPLHAVWHTSTVKMESPAPRACPPHMRRALPMDRGTSRNQNILLPATTGNLECRCCQLLIGRKAQETSWWSNGAVSRMFSRSCPWWEGQREEGIKMLMGQREKWTKETESPQMGGGVQHSNTEWKMMRRGELAMTSQIPVTTGWGSRELNIIHSHHASAAWQILRA